jgi:predicted PurR-regulated permease PerM
MKEYPPAIRFLVRIALIFAIAAILSITKQLLVPLSFSIFLAYLLYPSARRLEEFKIPRIATNFIVIIVFMGGIFTFLFILSQLFEGLSKDLPELRESFTFNIRLLQDSIDEVFGLSIAQQNEIIKTAGLNSDYFATLIEAGKNLFITLALIPVYTFLLLFYRDKFKEFVYMVVNSENSQAVKDIITKAAEVVPKYLKGLLVVCFLLIGLNTLGFYLIGVEYFLLFGLIAAIFNLIPYLGTVLGYGIVAFFVLGTQSPSVAGAVVIQFFIVQFLENNILTPNITGSYVRINPLVIIFSLIGAGLIWNLPGMFLVIPTLGVLKIIFESVDDWKPYAFLLGTSGTEEHSITIHSLRKRFGWE